MKQRGLNIILFIMLNFIALNIGTSVVFANDIFSVDTVVTGNLVEFNVKSEKYSEEDMTITILAKSDNSIKYTDQGNFMGNNYKFAAELPEGEYIGYIDIGVNTKIEIDEFKIVGEESGTEEPDTEEPEENKPSTNKPSTNKPSTNKPSTNKPGSNNQSSNNTDINDENDTQSSESQNISSESVNKDNDQNINKKTEENNEKDKESKNISITPFEIIIGIVVVGFGYQSFRYKD